MGIVSKVLSAIGMGENSADDSSEATQSTTDTAESESQAFGEKSMDDLLDDQDDS